MSAHNLLEYSDNDFMTLGNLGDHYRDKVNSDANKNNADNNKINNNKIITSKSFEENAKIIGTASNDNNSLDTEVVVPLKYLSNFWRFLDLPLINSEIELGLSLSK